MENMVLVGLSRQIALRRELDVIANNLANLNTTGFKGESVLFEEHLMPTARFDHFQRPNDRRVSFVLDRETHTNMSQGSVMPTEGKLDVAIDGDAFFAVETPGGNRYTRGGSFALNSAGELVTHAGYRVLGAGGPITLDPNDTDVMIASDGTISNREGERGKLNLVRFDSTAVLTKQGDGLYTSNVEPQPAGVTSNVIQGSLEKSNVQPILEMGRMIEITRAYTTLASLMSRADELRRSAIERLADVPM